MIFYSSERERNSWDMPSNIWIMGAVSGTLLATAVTAALISVKLCRGSPVASPVAVAANPGAGTGWLGPSLSSKAMLPVPPTGELEVVKEGPQ